MIFCRNWRQFFRHFPKWELPKPTILQNPIIIIVYAIFQNAEASFSKMAFFIVFSSFCKMRISILENEILIRSFFKTTKMRLPGIDCIQSIYIQYVIFLAIQIVCNIIWYDTIEYCRIFNCVQSIIIQYNLIR